MQKGYEAIVQPAMLYDTMLGNHNRAHSQDVSHRRLYVMMDTRKNIIRIERIR